MSIELKKSPSSLVAVGGSGKAEQPASGEAGSAFNRLELISKVFPSARSLVDDLLKVAQRGLPRMYASGGFGHTLRAVKKDGRWTEQLEGSSLRYTAMVALGLSCSDRSTQARALDGDTIAELVQRAVGRAEVSTDPGAIALVAWAAAETTATFAAPLFRKLRDAIASDAPISTVECAWILSAAVAARRLGDTLELTGMARARLLAARSGSALFGHMIPAAASGRFRSHIGCFADQVYPIQALSRLHAAVGDPEALSIAGACAQQICQLQGKDGQWWWHYDARNGTVAEGYPVYSVHQHAMAPMALLELHEAGGGDHFRAIAKGLRWLVEHPEIVEALIVPDKGVVWRKVARREPNKAVRMLAALTTAISPGFRLPAIDTLFPPVRVDHECRPYEFGLLMYAWLGGGTVARLAEQGESGARRP